ncbi:unnamed protein product [Brassicogethes aeneus]|uniref:Hexosyltransferase n=1 Tax=Brassicogethes aeneus TaxID=1431903 RepID=A0A9P0B2A4_BRAAE|nr:unnamed protein product [Brassicogethes aeneus]
MMAIRKKLMKLILGLLLGILCSQFFTISQIAIQDMCISKRLSPLDLINEENLRAQNKNLLFVGIMTASKYLDTRAKAVYETWGKEVPGKIMFFSSEFSYSEHVPLIALPGVDDSYPPQKKSFTMLKHMYDNYIDKYEWFLRGDDDVYMRTDRLEHLLRSVDSSKPWFIGQTGRGNIDEFGLLSLESDENFCMGGPGIIFSRESLKRMAPYVEECLQNLYTTHEDVELGRCVKRFAGISCTWSYEASSCDCKMQTIFYHNQSGVDAFTGDLKQKEVHRAITMHPVKRPEYMYKLHGYIKGLKIQTNHQDGIYLHRDIAVSMEQLGYSKDRLHKVILVKNLPLYPSKRGNDEYLGDTNILGTPTSLNRYTPQNLQDVLVWELISKTLYSHKDANPKKRMGSSLKEGLGDVTREMMDIINSYSKQRGRIIDFKEILYGYWRLDPIHGVDLILDLLLVYKKYRGHKMTVQVRRHAYVQQTFSDIVIREVNQNKIVDTFFDENTQQNLPVHKKLVHHLISKIGRNFPPLFNLINQEEPVINFILPISGRYESFRRFLNMYEEICLNMKERTKLIVILYKKNNLINDFVSSKYLIEQVQKKFSYSVVNVVYRNDDFSRGKALQYGVQELKNDDLMLFIDVDMIFDRNTLQRIRFNTVKNKTVYFPIVFSLYDPTFWNITYINKAYSYFDSNLINQRNGFWRQFGFGIVSIYKNDYVTLGGFNLKISGWGYEDVNFFDDVVNSNLKIVRSTDPGLIHVFHSEVCDQVSDVAQKNMCLGTKGSTLGSLQTLQDFYMKYKRYFR